HIVKRTGLVNAEDFSRARVGQSGKLIIGGGAWHVAESAQVPFADDVLMFFVFRAVVGRKVPAGIRQTALCFAWFGRNGVKLPVTKRAHMVEVWMERDSS